jgi:hypothetical protein
MMWLGCGLHESQNIAVGIADVEFGAVGHLAQRNDEGDFGGGEGNGEFRRVSDADADVDVPVLFEGFLVARRAVGVFEMDVAAVAGDSGVEVFVDEINGEAELVSIEREGTGNVGDLEDGREVDQIPWGFIHTGRRKCLVEVSERRMEKQLPNPRNPPNQRSGNAVD